MTKAIATHWNDTELRIVVAGDGEVEVVETVPLEADLSPTNLGKRLAESLAGYAGHRAQVVVAVSREQLEWQHLSLPPCPPEELDDLVRMQADRDLSAGVEDLGFDYLKLAGDEQTAYQVLTVSLPPKALASIRETCRAANLHLERIVPLSVGWPALTQQGPSADPSSTQVFVAPQESSATLWAISTGRIVLFRQFQLASAEELATRSSAIVNELRRTLLAMSQQEDHGSPRILLIGSLRHGLSETAIGIQDELGVEVKIVDVTADFPRLTNDELASSAIPLAGLAIDESLSQQPLLDLLHPHQRAKAEINIRTYALAATAGALLLALLAWTGYSRLQAPLEQAALDQAELALLEDSLGELEEYEQRATEIRNWQAEAPNLLLHLQQLSESFRPERLNDEEFSVDQDVVLEKLDIDKRQLTVEASSRNRQAVQPLESRLRESNYRPQRGTSGPGESVQDYPWQFKETIEITPTSDPVDDVASPQPSEEPQT